VSVPIAFTFLLILASVVAVFARRLRAPYTIALVVTGLAVSLAREQLVPDLDIGLHLTPELLFAVLLPALIYEAAFHFDLRDLQANWRAILTLAAPGLLVGIFAAGGLIFLASSFLDLGLPFLGALLVAAILSATDPVAVVALFKELGAPKRLGVLMEGESLVNDGVAVVVFSVVLVALGLDAHHDHLSVAWVVRFFGWEILGALLVGGTIGFAVSWFTAQVDDHLVEITLTTIAAFGSFLLASEIHASGVIACLLAGMLTGNFGAKHGMSATTRVAVASFWEYLAFLANSLVFLLVGLEISPARLAANWLPIVLVWLALLLARAGLVGAVLPPLERVEGSLRRGKGWAIIWGGLRGGIAMVLALSIPREWAHRELVIDVVFGTCLLTILVQGTTIRRLLGRFGLLADRGHEAAVEELRGRLRGLHAGLRFLDQRRDAGTVAPEVYQALHDELAEELEQARHQQQHSRELERRLLDEERSELQRQILVLRKSAVQQALADHQINETVARRLIGELDERLHALRSH